MTRDWALGMVFSLVGRGSVCYGAPSTGYGTSAAVGSGAAPRSWVLWR